MLRQLLQVLQEQERTGADQGLGYVRRTVGDLTLIRSQQYSTHSGYDEKHYFVVPFRRSKTGYVVHSMRCLPHGFSVINDLPKRRIFHFPNEAAVSAVERMLRRNARLQAATRVHSDRSSLGGRLTGLADTIDRIDRKLTRGALIVAGLVAVAHPIIGAALMLKALVPSAGVVTARLGLQQVGDRLKARRLRKEIAAAQERVLQQFKRASTLHVENALLGELDRVLDRLVAPPAPACAYPESGAGFAQADRARLLGLTAEAITDTYTDAFKKTETATALKLTPSHLAWLRAVRALRAHP